MKYVTWIMAWVSDYEPWFDETNSAGTLVKFGDKWAGLNWNNDEHIDILLHDIKNAGIDIIVSDLTNSFIGWKQSLKIQKKCVEIGLEFAVAFNHHGSKEEFEHQIELTKEHFLSQPGYAYKDGKPLVVTYVTREWRDAVQKSGSPYLEEFTLEWASGEDSDINKWGWQVEPFIGPMTSSDSMFITPSIKWGNYDSVWRKSLAWFDFCFYKATYCNAAYRIVGSYDDLWERNCWYKADTSQSIRMSQMRDLYGRVSVDAYYNRVCQWIQNGKPTVNAGGILNDGVYRIATPDQRIRLTTNQHDAKVGAPITTQFAYAGVSLNFAFYHLGNGEYRIIKLNSGLSVTFGDQVTQEWDEDIDTQKFYIEKNEKYYRLKNKATGEYLAIRDDQVVQEKTPSEGCDFELECVADYITME